MLELSEQDVELNATCSSKEDAIRFIVEKMVDGDLVEPGYLHGVLEREQQTSTFLGSGIAIPHGTTETRDLIRQTGIKVIRFPDGLDWGDQQTVYTAIGVAAKSDEHLGILRKLTHIMNSSELVNSLHTSPSAQEVIAIFSRDLAAGGGNNELLIHPDNIRTGMTLSSLIEAKAIAASILCGHGSWEAGNLNALMTDATIKLDDNIWLICAQNRDRQSSLAAVQFHASGQTHLDPSKQLLITVVTQGDNHRELMDRLIDFQRKNALIKLVAAASPQILCGLLNGTEAGVQSVTCRLPLPHGLHARPATQLVKLVKSLGVEVFAENLDENSALVKVNSIARLIGLGVCFGHRIRFTIRDPDAKKHLDTLLREVANGLGDDTAPLPDKPDSSTLSSSSPPPSPDTPPSQADKPASSSEPGPGDTIKGLCGAPGMAIGTAFVQHDIVFHYEEFSSNNEEQILRLEKAVTAVKYLISERIKASEKDDARQIAEMHIALLDDPALVDDSCELIRQNKSAEWSWHTTYEKIANAQEKNPDPLMAERAADFRDVGSQVLSILTGQEIESNETEPHILICHELPASKVPMLDPQITLAVVTAAGGVTSHAAILARSTGIPLLVGCGNRVLSIANGTQLIINCDEQLARLVENDEEITQARQEKQRQDDASEAAYQHCHEPAITTDGVQMEVVANITNSSQVKSALEYGAEGIGLYRSEFVYMEYGQEPTIEQQTMEYQQALQQLKGRPLVVRTLDVGGDKPLPYIPIAKEENPFLGVRGARLSLLHPEILQRQLQALLTAAASTEGTKSNLKIMFPMICDISEWRQLRTLIHTVAADHPDVHFELGMMIEVPSAALLADTFAPELDFFSIGTNDLTQYTMAIDRGHPTLSGMADPIHPAVLRLIKMTVDAANQHKAWVGVCGELAADLLGAIVLTGLGVKELSMSVKSIPQAKAHIRKVSLAQSKAMAEAALKAESAQAVRALKIEDF